MRTKPQRLCRKNRVTRIHEKRRIETCCRDARLRRSGSQRKEISQTQRSLVGGQAAFCSFSRVQSATHEALIDASCLSCPTLANPDATTRIVHPPPNGWVVNTSALYVAPATV